METAKTKGNEDKGLEIVRRKEVHLPWRQTESIPTTKPNNYGRHAGPKQRHSAAAAAPIAKLLSINRGNSCGAASKRYDLRDGNRTGEYGDRDGAVVG